MYVNDLGMTEEALTRAEARLLIIASPVAEVRQSGSDSLVGFEPPPLGSIRRVVDSSQAVGLQ